MTPKDFIKSYEKALASQDWHKVAPLIHEKATVIFSNGFVNDGKAAIKTAFERNFVLIKNEKYAIKNVKWLLLKDTVVVYLFDFHWNGVINGIVKQGAGRGTSVLVKENETWYLMTEHLGSIPVNQ